MDTDLIAFWQPCSVRLRGPANLLCVTANVRLRPGELIVENTTQSARYQYRAPIALIDITSDRVITISWAQLDGSVPDMRFDMLAAPPGVVSCQVTLDQPYPARASYRVATMLHVPENTWVYIG